MAVEQGSKRNSVISLHRGADGLSSLLGFLNEIMLDEYPQIEPHMGRLVSTVDQLKWVSPEEQKRVASKTLNKRVFVGILLAAGGPDVSLRSFFIKSDIQPFDFEEGTPRLYLSRNTALNKLEDVNPLVRIKAAIGTMFKICDTNLSLLPKPKKVPDSIARVAQREFRGEFDAEIKSVMTSSIGEKLEDIELAAIEELMYLLIYYGSAKQIASGGQLELVLPGQDNLSPEIVSQEPFCLDMKCYLSVPVMNRFLKRVTEEGYAGAIPLNIASETLTRSGRAAKVLRLLELEEDRQESMRRYISSQLAIDEMKRQNNQRQDNISSRLEDRSKQISAPDTILVAENLGL